MKYKVYITSSDNQEVQVKASSKEEALQIAKTNKKYGYKTRIVKLIKKKIISPTLEKCIIKNVKIITKEILNNLDLNYSSLTIKEKHCVMQNLHCLIDKQMNLFMRSIE